MSTTLQLPKTLQEAVASSPTPQRTFDYAVKLRWPDGKVACPRCDGTEHSFISTRRIWFCKDCKKAIHGQGGNHLEDSALGMDKWMIAVWLIVNAKNGISFLRSGPRSGNHPKVGMVYDAPRSPCPA